MLFYLSANLYLLTGMFNLLMFNVITDNVGFMFAFCLFVFYRSCNSFIPLFFYYCLYFLLKQSIKSKQTWDLKPYLSISKTYKNLATCMCILDYRSMFKIFKAPYRHLLPHIFHLCILVSLVLAPTCVTVLGSCDIKELLLIVFNKCPNDRAFLTEWALGQVKSRQAL